MTDEANTENGLPPKLDLRKKGIALPGGTLPPAVGSPAAPAASVSARPGPEGGVTEGPVPALGTMRIKIPDVDKQAAASATAAVGAVLKPTGTPASPLTPKPAAAPMTPLTARPVPPAVNAVLKPAGAPVSPLTPKPAAAPAAPQAARPVAPAAGPRTEAPPVPTDTRGRDNSASPSPARPESGGAARPVFRPAMAPKTIKLKKPVPIGIKRETANLSADSGSKRSTSKLSLPIDIGGPTEAVPVGTKTIRIAPSQIGPAAATDKADAQGGHIGTPAGVAQTPDPKRQTSRISLESVLGGGSSSSPSSPSSPSLSSSPKTVKLKRPEPTASTIKVQSAGTPAGDSPPKTEPVEDDAGDEVPESEKKTIKVKRPSIKMPARKTGGGQDETTDQPTMFAPPVAVVAGEDRVHWTFVIAACAATLVSFVLIYVLLAQVLGPNISMTELSYGAPGTVLEWPGRIKP